MLFLSYSLCIVHLYINLLCTPECLHIKDRVCLETINMGIKVKTDRHGFPSHYRLQIIFLLSQVCLNKFIANPTASRQIPT